MPSDHPATTFEPKAWETSTDVSRANFSEVFEALAPLEVLRRVVEALDPVQVDDARWLTTVERMFRYPDWIAKGWCSLGLLGMPTMVDAVTRRPRAPGPEVWARLAQLLTDAGSNGEVARARFAQVLDRIGLDRTVALLDTAPASGTPPQARMWSDEREPPAHYPTAMLWCESALRLGESLIQVSEALPDRSHLKAVADRLGAPLLDYWTRIPEGDQRSPLMAARLQRTLDMMGRLGALDATDIPGIVDRVVTAAHSMKNCMVLTHDTHMTSLRNGFMPQWWTVLPLRFAHGYLERMFFRPLSPSHWRRAIGTGPEAAPRAQRLLSGQVVDDSMIERLAQLKGMDPASRTLFETRLLARAFDAERGLLEGPTVADGPGTSHAPQGRRRL